MYTHTYIHMYYVCIVCLLSLGAPAAHSARQPLAWWPRRVSLLG